LDSGLGPAFAILSRGGEIDHGEADRHGVDEIPALLRCFDAEAFEKAPNTGDNSIREFPEQVAHGRRLIGGLRERHHHPSVLVPHGDASDRRRCGGRRRRIEHRVDRSELIVDRRAGNGGQKIEAGGEIIREMTLSQGGELCDLRLREAREAALAKDRKPCPDDVLSTVWHVRRISWSTYQYDCELALSRVMARWCTAPLVNALWHHSQWQSRVDSMAQAGSITPARSVMAPYCAGCR
jgi:hypothetical protein